MRRLFRLMSIILFGFLCISISHAEYKDFVITPFHYFGMNGISPCNDIVNPDGTIQEKTFERLKADLRKAKEAGAETIRFELWWGEIEPRQGEFCWEFSDKIFAEILRAGLEPYPVLGYYSNWSGATCPKTDQDRKEYGEYVYQVVKRYKGVVKRWEIWNEPNKTPYWIPTPSPKDYTDLLKVAYTRATEANPSCEVVGLCVDGPDYDFFERCYRNGAAHFLGAVSYHHYDETRDERILERELQNIQRIKAHYGNLELPIYVSEMGMTSDSNPKLGDISEDDQANWIIKKHIVGIANKASRMYYYTMMDEDPTDKGNVWLGLERRSGAKKKSWVAYKAMTSRLAKADFLGKIYPICSESGRAPEIECHLFRTKMGELAAYGWVRKDGLPLSITFPSDHNIIVENIYGEVRNVAEYNQKTQMVTIVLNKDPCYLKNLPEKMLDLCSLKFDPNPLFIVPGEDNEFRLYSAYGYHADTTDPFKKILMESLLKYLHDEGFEVSYPPEHYLLYSHQTERIPIQYIYPPSHPSFDTKSITYTGERGYSGQFKIIMEQPFRLDLYPDYGVTAGKAMFLTGMGVDKCVPMTLVYQNRSYETVHPKVVWTGPQMIYPLDSRNILRSFIQESTAIPEEPGDLQISQVKVVVLPGDNAITAKVISDRGGSTSTTFRIWGQPYFPADYMNNQRAINWNDIPEIEIVPPRQQILPFIDDKILNSRDLSAKVKIFWTDQHLLVKATVKDKTPLVNPHGGCDIWRGDSLELFLGLDGPTCFTQYRGKQFHIGISPGDNGNDPVVWNWTPLPIKGNPVPPDGHEIVDAHVKLSQTLDGYVVEAEIPLKEFGWKPVPNKPIGFDLALNNKDNPDYYSNEAVLMWNGTRLNWTDPSYWGAAVLIDQVTE